MQRAQALEDLEDEEISEDDRILKKLLSKSRALSVAEKFEYFRILCPFGETTYDGASFSE